MINNRVAFMSALTLGILSLFLLGNSQAATLNSATFEPSDVTIIDGGSGMTFSIVFDAEDGESIVGDTFVATFGDPDGSWEFEIELECTDDVSSCVDGETDGEGDELDGTWSTPDSVIASQLVSEVGDENVWYGFEVTTSVDTFSVFNQDTGVVVNTLPVLSDDAAVAGDDMPYSERTISITYTDADDHDGELFAEVCEDSNPASCETEFGLTKEAGGDNTAGAVYSATFTTAFGGALTATVSGTDGFNAAEDERTASFSVDTETPWLVSDSVSPTSAGTSDQVTFSVVYCVFEAQAGPSVSVNVGGSSHDLTEGASADDDCTNGVGNAYSVSTTVAWAAAAQAVQFSASNDAGTGDNLDSSSVTINDLPTMSDNLVERVGDDFVIKITATDANLAAGDSLSVWAVVEHSASPYAMSFEDPHYEVTIPEANIINERGGLRAVTFAVWDTYSEIVSGDYGDQIDVTKTSNFDVEIKGGGSTDITTAPGTSTYTYTITNNGNFEDIFTIATSSVNGWFSAVDDVTVAYGSASDFDVTVTVPNALAGTKDTWSVTSTATNDGTVDDDVVSGTTTVDTVTGHSITGDSTISGNPGDTVTYHFTVLNTGNAEETYAYTVTATNGWTALPAGGPFTLAMGASETIAVTHSIPADAGAGDGSTVTFTVVGGSISEVTTTANQVYELSVSAGTLTGLKPGDTGQLSFTITNEGNGFDTYTIGYNGIWATGVSSTTEPIASGSFATITVDVAIPANAASGASSVVGLSASGSMDTGASDSYDVVVASSTRSLTITGADAYTFNEGTVGQGTATIQNNGVSTTFIVTSMSDSVSFTTSSYEVSAGASQEITFDIMATASGDQSFTISDNVDFNPATHTFALTARTFSTNMSSWGLVECSNTGVTCTYDNSWDGSAYANAGTWTTSMVYEDTNGQIGTHSFDTTIANTNPTVAAPSLSNPVQGAKHQFSFTIPTDADGTVTHFVIEFGDGEEQTFQASDFSGQTVTATHTYSESGNFDVVATAYDNSGGVTSQTVAVSVGDEMVTLEKGYTYNLIALIGFFLLGTILSGTAFKMQQGEIAGDEEMNERDRQRLESVERRMESISEREELMEVSAYDASRAATKLEEHIAAFNSILVKAQEIAAEDKLKELEAAEEARQKKDEEMQLDLEDPDIEMVAERFHESLARLVAARDDLSKIEKHLARILKMERDEQLEKLTEMTESYETTKRKIDALESSKEARDAAAVENNIMNMLSAAASGGSMNDADFGDFGDFGGDDEYEVEIYEDEDGSFYYIDPDTGEEVPCDEEGNAL